MTYNTIISNYFKRNRIKGKNQ
ncbi:MAG: hypothetical protein D6B27_08830 [Gammaproteobacteria bacterium]|nr:MAG: hypothetical protein D6B27_08830 [Gammaproteobacteria bacterium]